MLHKCNNLLPVIVINDSEWKLFEFWLVGLKKKKKKKERKRKTKVKQSNLETAVVTIV